MVCLGTDGPDELHFLVIRQPQKYHDEYREAPMKLIEEKVPAGAKTLPKGKPVPKQPSKVIDLVSLLQESLGRSAGGAKQQSKAARHRVQHNKAA